MTAAAALATPAAAPAIRLDGVTKTFAGEAGAGVTALAGIDLTIARNAFVSLVGASGCGKSTLLRLISGLIGPSAGRVQVDGLDPAAYQRDRKFGFVFQDATLLPWKTALENVVLPLQILRRHTPSERTALARRMLALVRLDGFEDSYPSQLSGGMRQRVSIARSLVYQPEILLMDEPFGALDEITRLEMNEELLRVWDETRGTIVFVTHSLSEALFLSDVVVVMSARPGRIREVVDVGFPRPRAPAIRSSADFVGLIARLEDRIRER